MCFPCLGIPQLSTIPALFMAYMLLTIVGQAWNMLVVWIFFHSTTRSNWCMLVHEALINQLHCLWLWKFYSTLNWAIFVELEATNFLWPSEAEDQCVRTGPFWRSEVSAHWPIYLIFYFILTNQWTDTMGQLSTNMGEYENAQLIIINMFWLKSFPLLRLCTML
jgi:hypothetical protein